MSIHNRKHKTKEHTNRTNKWEAAKQTAWHKQLLIKFYVYIKYLLDKMLDRLVKNNIQK